MAFSHLFTPAKLGTVEAPNRYVQTPVQTRGADSDGYVTEELLDFHRVRKGAGIVIAQQSYAWPQAKLARGIALWDDCYIEKLSRLAGVIKANGSLAFIQMGGAGSRHAGDYESLAPSPVVGSWDMKRPREITREEMMDYLQRYAEAGRRIYQAGFDGISLHGSAGKFISQFLSPHSNRRSDEFGGSAGNRVRYPLMIIDAIRKLTRSDFPVIMRTEVCDRMEGGLSLEEGIEQVRIMAEAGVDAFLLSLGGQERLWHDVPIYASDLDDLAGEMAKVKKALPDVTIIVNSGIHDPAFAEKLIENKLADFIGICRPLLADPDYVEKVRTNNVQNIRQCLRCNNCQTWAARSHLKNRGICCTVNPALMMEKAFTSQPAEKPQTIYVLGGGVAGMSCAKTLAQRGHRVDLFETTGELGGQWLVASAGRDKTSFRTLIPGLMREMERAGANIHLKATLDKEAILGAKPDQVVLATGATPLALRGIDGLDGDIKIVFAFDVLRNKAETGQNVVVLGGRYIGLETALKLGQEGKHVSLVEMNELGRGLILRIRGWLFQQLSALPNIRMFPNSVLFRLTNDKAEIAHGGSLFMVDADTLVLAIGTVPNKILQKDLKDAGIPVHTIGDCDHIGDCLEAIAQGTELGLKL